MSAPRLLDLFCGAGGAATGYHRAGFDVTGVDIAPQPRYPFTFHQADALEFLAAHGRDFDVIHASPPCQQYTSLRALQNKQYTDLIAPTRDLLIASGKPWIIENVIGSPLGFGIFLCGRMFHGLRVYRHRRFETSFWLWQPDHPPHRIRAGAPGTKGGRGRKAHYMSGGFITITGNVGTYCMDAMGIDWMTGRELSQAIPPTYTEWIGRQLLSQWQSKGNIFR
jgi:DNA (cytosine-5)-methyltransferase 1